MAASDRCPRCGALVLPEEKFCVQCGAPLGEAAPAEEVPTPETAATGEDSSTIRLELPYQPAPASVPARPATIDELAAYCAANGMPLEKMRFFIGQDYRQPRAFGIYRDGDEFVVYKNKADGSRAVRYHGPDEAYAVNELFQKLLDECHARGIYPDGKPVLTVAQKRKKRRALRLMAIAVVVAVALAVAMVFIGVRAHRYDGYYTRLEDDGYYYRYGDDWYYYGGNDWVEVDDFPYENAGEYYLGEDFDDDWSVDDFRDSSAWDQIQEESHTDSSDYSSWDSGGTDWSSDW